VTPCSAWRLYVIIDRPTVGDRDLQDVTAAAIRGGADVIQLRDKTASPDQLLEEARALLAVTRAAEIPLIINDHVEVAAACGAEGVHLGQDDASIAAARRRLGPGRLIGKSTHTFEQALVAYLDQADYLGLGPIFPTPTKPTYEAVGPELIQEVRLRVEIPVVCIGGINRDTITRVLKRNGECVAVVRAVCGDPDPEAAARHLKRLLQREACSTDPSPAVS
jgi:thiamine-phosphate pyrophosphorylase